MITWRKVDSTYDWSNENVALSPHCQTRGERNIPRSSWELKQTREHGSPVPLKARGSRTTPSPALDAFRERARYNSYAGGRTNLRMQQRVPLLLSFLLYSLLSHMRVHVDGILISIATLMVWSARTRETL